jgi:hypothetical protein
MASPEDKAQEIFADATVLPVISIDRRSKCSVRYKN